MRGIQPTLWLRSLPVSNILLLSDHVPLVLQFNVRDNLTATQLAHVFFDPGVLDDTSMVETLLVSLESRPALDISAFVAEFVATASQVRYQPLLWICRETHLLMEMLF